MSDLIAVVVELHRPMLEEVESWADGDNPDEHDARFPECEAMVRADDRLCPGHTYTIQVCQECGYTHNGETPAYRPWPCATLRAARSDGTLGEARSLLDAWCTAANDGEDLAPLRAQTLAWMEGS